MGLEAGGPQLGQAQSLTGDTAWAGRPCSPHPCCCSPCPGARLSLSPEISQRVPSYGALVSSSRAGTELPQPLLGQQRGVWVPQGPQASHTYTHKPGLTSLASALGCPAGSLLGVSWGLKTHSLV